jgi:hypothetical protein
MKAINMQALQAAKLATNERVKVLTENETYFDGTCFCASGKRRFDKLLEKHFQSNLSDALHFDK